MKVNKKGIKKEKKEAHRRHRMKKWIFVISLSFGMFANAQVGVLNLAPGFGTAKGLLAVVKLNSQELAKTLPPELKLAPELIFSDESYPVAMFIGQHENLGTSLQGKEIVLERLYSEATLTFTVIGPHEPTRRYTYTSKVIVDSVTALLMGQALGYPKKMASIEVSDRTFFAQTVDRAPILKADMQSVDNYDSVSLKRNLEFLNQNMHRTITKSSLGYICFDFLWDFSSPDSVLPVHVQVELSDEFAGAELSGRYRSAPLDQDPFGAIQISSPWKMKNFRLCE